MDSEQNLLLQPEAIRLLTSVFDISSADVATDAHRVLELGAENDDLLVSIAKRYQWPASKTVRYLRNLLSALGRRPEHIQQLAIEDHNYPQFAEYIRCMLVKELHILNLLEEDLKRHSVKDLHQRVRLEEVSTAIALLQHCLDRLMVALGE